LHAFPKDEDKDEDPGPNRYGKTDIIVAVYKGWGSLRCIACMDTLTITNSQIIIR